MDRPELEKMHTAAVFLDEPACTELRKVIDYALSLEARIKQYDDAVERSINPIFGPDREGYWKCWRCMRFVKDGWRCCDD